MVNSQQIWVEWMHKWHVRTFGAQKYYNTDGARYTHALKSLAMMHARYGGYHLDQFRVKEWELGNRDYAYWERQD